MLKIKLSPLQLAALTHRLNEECVMYKPETPIGKMVHALMLDFYKKLHNRSAFPLPINRFTIPAAQSMAFLVYFRNSQPKREMSDTLIDYIVGAIDQKQ